MSMRLFSMTVPLCALLACSASDADDQPLGDVVDLRAEFPTPPDGAQVFETPDYTIQAYTETQMCFVTTYTGPDVGIRGQWNYQTRMGHHVTLFGTQVTERELPDGSQWDCTRVEDLEMTSLEPIMIGGTLDELSGGGVVNEFVLPDGIAAPLKSGQRLVIQSHYLNTSPDDVLVRDEVHLQLAAEDEVEIWSAPLVNTVTDFQIPAETDGYTLAFDCTFDDTLTLLYLGGHLHEWGKSFSTTWTHAGGTEMLYEIEDWDPVLRDAPTYTRYDEGLVIEAGDVFTTSCTWFNDTGAVLEFPQEMCVTFGMVYPTRVPVICDPS